MYAKIYPVYDKYIHGVKTKILEQSPMCLSPRGSSNKVTKGLAGLHDVSFKPLLNELILETVDMPYF